MTVLIQLDLRVLNDALAKKKILIKCIVDDYLTFYRNSIMLAALNELIKMIYSMKTANLILSELFTTNRLLNSLSEIIDSQESTESVSTRKDIFAFIF